MAISGYRNLAKLRVAVLAFFFVTPAAVAAVDCESFFNDDFSSISMPKKGWASSRTFDWDDNIIRMPTKVALQHLGGGPELLISTREWALHREEIGIKGKYVDYSDDGPLAHRFAHDTNSGVNYFLEDLRYLVENVPPSEWQASSFRAFVSACETPEGAESTYLLTSREQSPDTLHEGLLFLQELGFIKHVPPKKNILPVFWEGWGDKIPGKNSQEKKSYAFRFMILDLRNSLPVDESAWMIHPDGIEAGAVRANSATYSDDDWKNFDMLSRLVGREFAAGRWPNLKIRLFFTPHDDPNHAPGAFVVKSDGTLRPLLPAEVHERL